LNVMVLGATGFIGQPLVGQLAAQGHAVVAVSRRPPDGLNDIGVVSLAMDRGDAPALAAVAKAHRIDAVIDLLAMTLASTEPVIEHLAGRVGRYVMASSGDVYRQYGALHRREPVADPSPRLDEDSPLRTGLCPYRATPRRAVDDPAAWMDDYDKIPIEQAIARRPDLPAVVVRLPMLYGPGDRQNRFAWAIKPMRANASVIEVDAQWAAWRSSYGYVDDVAAALMLAAVHPGAANRTYNAGPLEAPDHAHWVGRFAGLLGWRGELRTIARGSVAEPQRSRLEALDLSIPLVMDTRRIRRELGYAEVVDPATALRTTVAGAFPAAKTN
jgi:nucleoside-diphosphate-sugar epimerase